MTLNMDRENKICPFAFGRLEISDQAYSPCCPDWTTEEFNLLAQTYPGWNGQAARELRRRLLNSDYSFCRREVCCVKLVSLSELKKNGGHLGPFHAISPQNIKAIEDRETFLPDEASVITISVDERCNLNCPSCRSESITHINKAKQEELNQVKARIWKTRKHLKALHFTNGEPLYSPWARTMIRSFTSSEFPSLKNIAIMTNGLLLNEKSLKPLYPGFEKVTEISVSVDAGDSETYTQVRGADYNEILKNISYAVKTLKPSHVRSVDVNFVLQKLNYRSLPLFIKTMRELGVDDLNIHELHPWEKMKINYYEHAVHIPTHPEHHFLKETLWNLPDDVLGSLPATLQSLVRTL